MDPSWGVGKYIIRRQPSVMDCDELVLRLVHSYVHRHLGGNFFSIGGFFVGRVGF